MTTLTTIQYVCTGAATLDRIVCSKMIWKNHIKIISMYSGGQWSLVGPRDSTGSQTVGYYLATKQQQQKLMIKIISVNGTTQYNIIKNKS